MAKKKVCRKRGHAVAPRMGTRRHKCTRSPRLQAELRLLMRIKQRLLVARNNLRKAENELISIQKALKGMA